MNIDLYDEKIADLINGLSNIIRNDYTSDNNNLELYVGKDTIKSIDNKKYQVIYGRRGTGKTHLLKAYKEKMLNEFKKNKEFPIYIDLRGILPTISNMTENYIESAVIIFINIVNEIVDSILQSIPLLYDMNKIQEIIGQRKKKNDLKKILNNFQYDFNGKTFEKLSDIEISREDVEKLEASISAKVSEKPEVSGKAGGEYQYKEKSNSSNIKYMTFENISKSIPNLLSELGINRIVCMLDEWSEIKLDIQIVLADLIKKAFITRPVTFKITAIPNRTNLGKMIDDEFIGLEDGGDIFPFSLDNRFIYELEQEQTKDFFNDLLYRHLDNIDKNKGYNVISNYPKTRFINLFLANQALREILIASAGIPRDFISLFINSYERFKVNTSSRNSRIGVRDIRVATIDWYKLDKKNKLII